MYLRILLSTLLILTTQLTFAQLTVEIEPSSYTHNNSSFTVNGNFSTLVNDLDISDLELLNANSTNLNIDESIEYVGDINSGQIKNVSYIVSNEQFSFVSNSNDSIFKIDSQGIIIDSFGGNGVENGKFDGIRGMDIYNDKIYVIDRINDRVQIIDLSGNYVENLNIGGDYNDIAVNSSSIYLLASSTLIKIFDNEGNFIRDKVAIRNSKLRQTFISVSRLNDQMLLLGTREAFNPLFADWVNRRYYIDTFDNNVVIGSVTIARAISSFADITVDNNFIYVLDGMRLMKFNLDLNYGGDLSIDFNQLNSRVINITSIGSQLLTTEKNSESIHLLNQKSFFEFDVLPDADMSVSASIPQDRVSDLAGNNNEASNLIEIIYDGIEPEIVITSSLSSPTIQLPLAFDLELSEESTGFAFEDIRINEPYLDANLTGSGLNYQLELWPAANTSYSVSVLDSAFVDLAGNYNNASNILSIEYLSDRPAVELIFPEEFSTDTIVSVQLVFSEPVTNLTSDAFLVENVTILNDFIDTNIYESVELDVLPDLYFQSLTLSLKDSAVVNLTGHPSFPSNDISLLYDVDKPRVIFQEYGSTAEETIEVVFQIIDNSSPKDFSASDIIIENGVLLNLDQPSSFSFVGSTFRRISRNYYLTLETQANDTLKIIIPDNVYFDDVGNGNIGDTLSIVVDKVRPEISLTTESIFSTLDNTQINVQLSENIDFSYFQFNIDGGTIISMEGEGLNRLLNVQFGENSSEITMYLRENAIFDQAGNGNLRSNDLKIVYDPIPLELSFSSSVGNLIGDSNIDSFDLTLTFSEEVMNFEVDDFIIFGGVINSFDMINGTNYIVSIGLDDFEESVVEIYIEENSLSKLSGFGNPFFEFFILIDKSRPVTEIKTSMGKEMISGETEIEINFDDPVFNFQSDPISCLAFSGDCFTESDIIVEGGNIKDFSGDLGRYNFVLEPIARNIQVSIPPNVAFNITNIGNMASNILKLTYKDGAVVVGTLEEGAKGISFWIEHSMKMNVYSPTKSTVQILDLNGKVMSYEKGEGTWTKNLMFLNEGVYILVVESQKEVLLEKFLINR